MKEMEKPMVRTTKKERQFSEIIARLHVLGDKLDEVLRRLPSSEWKPTVPSWPPSLPKAEPSPRVDPNLGTL